MTPTSWKEGEAGDKGRQGGKGGGKAVGGWGLCGRLRELVGDLQGQRVKSANNGSESHQLGIRGHLFREGDGRRIGRRENSRKMDCFPPKPLFLLSFFPPSSFLQFHFLKSIVPEVCHCE